MKAIVLNKAFFLADIAVAKRKKERLMQNEQVKIYEYSGKVGMMGLGWIFMFVFGLLSLSLSMIYVLATYYIPFVYLNFLLTVCFGGVCGYAVALGGKLGKVRNVTLYLTIGLLIGILAEYCQWVVWVYVHSGYKDWIFAPNGLYNFISAVAADGFWTMFGITVKGKLLYSIWLIEGLIIILCAPSGAYGYLLSTPFCEECKKWFKSRENLNIMPLEAIVAPAVIRNHLIAGDCSTLLDLNMKNSKGDSYTKLKISSCPKCDRFHVLSIYAVAVSCDEDGEYEAESPVIENLMLTTPMFQCIMDSYFCQNETLPRVGSPLQTVYT